MTKIFFRRRFSENTRNGVRIGIPREIVNSIGCGGSHATIYVENGLICILPDESIPQMTDDEIQNVFGMPIGKDRFKDDDDEVLVT